MTTWHVGYSRLDEKILDPAKKSGLEENSLYSRLEVKILDSEKKIFLLERKILDSKKKTPTNFVHYGLLYNSPAILKTSLAKEKFSHSNDENCYKCTRSFPCYRSSSVH